jgi:hypothetical protein
LVAILEQEIIRLLGAPGAGGEFRHRRRVCGLVPGALDVVDELPCLLDLVAAGEEGGVAGDGI